MPRLAAAASTLHRCLCILSLMLTNLLPFVDPSLTTSRRQVSDFLFNNSSAFSKHRPWRVYMGHQVPKSQMLQACAACKHRPCVPFAVRPAPTGLPAVRKLPRHGRCHSLEDHHTLKARGRLHRGAAFGGCGASVNEYVNRHLQKRTSSGMQRCAGLFAPVLQR